LPCARPGGVRVGVRRVALHTVIVACAVTALCCRPLINARRLAQEGVGAFHDAYDTGRFTFIYATADPLYRRSVSAAVAAETLTAVRGVLGPVKATRTVGVNIDFKNGGAVVFLVQQTAFVHGDGTERFSFRVSDGIAALISYQVDSKALTNLGKLQRG